MDSVQNLAAILVKARYVAYPILIVCGFGLGLIALGRGTRYTNGRRRQYRALASIALSLMWIGMAGWAGVAGYATRSTPSTGVSIAFSLGILWLAGSLLWLAVIVVREEWMVTRARRPSKE